MAHPVVPIRFVAVLISSLGKRRVAEEDCLVHVVQLRLLLGADIFPKALPANHGARR